MLTKAGRKYHKPFSNDQAMTGCIPQPLVQLFTSFFTIFLQFFTSFFFTFFTVFFTFFTVFYKAMEWAADFGAGDLGGLVLSARGGGGSPKGLVHVVLMQFFTVASLIIEVFETYFSDTVIT